MIKPEITGLVLAGGKSSRFGSNKALATLQGKTFLHKAFTLIQPFCYEVYVSGNGEWYDISKYPIIPDIIPGMGPLGGIWSVMQQVNAKYLLVHTCDMPLMTPWMIRRLIEEGGGYEAVFWKQEDGKIQLFPSLFSIDFFPVINRMISQHEFSLNKLLPAYGVKMLEAKDTECKSFFNMNYFSDYKLLENNMPVDW
ncbi:molybdenum cofactor guanylyltransferase [Coprobacter tertius]|uniref:Probable molybdenum cofactor guanylyltransferase n=1 Tax=Coprobacter tertius TaxID=2944915 RepID=A0ABT1MH17_9BACT|nr:molybdenum cofactor guanylyltransferase [Coprobacter tertius]MCP9611920.1 molybdenum cofactor guanylyltransferase [Coprobacter tertius]